MRSAFTCTYHEKRETMEELYDERDWDLLTQRRELASFVLEDETGDAVLLVRSGALIGDVLAPRDFVHTMAKPVRDWQLEVYDADWKPLHTRSPCDGRPYDLSIAQFADDLAKKFVGRTMDECMSASDESGEVLDRCLVEYGYKQNADKKERSLWCVGLGPRKAMGDFYSGRKAGGRAVCLM